MNVLVVGGGFLGSAIARRLHSSGHRVTILTPHPPASHAGGITFRRGRLAMGEDLGDVLRGVDTVVDAANSLVPATVQANPAATMGPSLAAAVWLTQGCIDEGVSTLVHLSSGGTVYGPGEAERPHQETDALRPISAYGGLKAATELAISSITADSSTRAVMLRVSNAYGPGQNLRRPQGIIGIALDQYRRGLPTTLFGAHDVTRDYVYVDDVAECVDVVSTTDHAGPLNVGSGVGMSLASVMDVLGRTVGEALPVEHQPIRSFDVRHSTLDVTRAARLGWTPRTSMEDGVRATWAWLDGRDPASDHDEHWELPHHAGT